MSILGNMLGGAAYYKHARGDFETARKMYESAIQKGMNKPERLGPYGVLLMRDGEFEKAIEIFSKIIAMRPKPLIRIKTRINRSIAFTKLGRIDEAKVALEDIHKRYRSKQVYESLGYLYVVTDDEICEKYNLEAYEYDPENYVILDNLCQYYVYKKDYANARKYGELAYTVDDNKVDNLYHLSIIEAHDKNTEKAKEYCEHMMKAPLTALNDIKQETRLKTYKNIMGKEYEPEIIEEEDQKTS